MSSYGFNHSVSGIVVTSSQRSHETNRKSALDNSCRRANDLLGHELLSVEGDRDVLDVDNRDGHDVADPAAQMRAQPTRARDIDLYGTLPRLRRGMNN